MDVGASVGGVKVRDASPPGPVDVPGLGLDSLPKVNLGGVVGATVGEVGNVVGEVSEVGGVKLPLGNAAGVDGLNV